MTATTVAGHRQVIVGTSDSDVVLGVSTFVAHRQQIGALWIAFGMRQCYRYIPVHGIVRELGPSKALVLPAVTECDTTLTFFGEGKKTAWSVWQPLPELILPLQLISSPSETQEMIRTHKNVNERFVTQFYGVYEEKITIVDATRLYILQHKRRDFEHMLPSSDALHKHSLRVDIYGVIHSTNLQIQCLQLIGDGSKKLLTLRQLQFISRFPSFR